MQAGESEQSTASQSEQTEFAEFDDDYLHRIGNELDALANQRTTSEMDSTERCDGVVLGTATVWRTKSTFLYAASRGRAVRN